MITVTSLTHPTMISKIRAGLHYALMGHGHKMNGHGNRVYITNTQGRNIMRLDWIGNGNYIVYGSESRNITTIVKQALKLASMAEAKAIPATPNEAAKALVAGNPDLKARLAKLATLAGMGVALTGCSNPGAMMTMYHVIGSIFT